MARTPTRSQARLFANLIADLTPEVRRAFMASVTDLQANVNWPRLLAELERSNIEGAISALNISPAAWAEYSSAMTAAQPFTTTLISSNMVMFKQCLVWDKVAPRGFLNAKKMHLSRHEDIVVFYSKPPTYNPQMEVRGKPRSKGSYNKKKGDGDMVYGAFKNTETYNNTYYPTSVLKFSNAVQKGKVHPTQKPVALMEYLIKTYTNEGETVLDFTMGSGTTGVACVNTNRNFIGIELDPEYFAIAEKRISATKGAA